MGGSRMTDKEKESKPSDTGFVPRPHRGNIEPAVRKKTKETISVNNMAEAESMLEDRTVKYSKSNCYVTGFIGKFSDRKLIQVRVG